jgi:copper(I)-binding protein
MLVDLAGPLVAGTSVALTLRFARAGELVLDVPVIDARATPSPAVHGH